jgi:Domain of Unknown Function with PDB structure (DUF3857)
MPYPSRKKQTARLYHGQTSGLRKRFPVHAAQPVASLRFTALPARPTLACVRVRNAIPRFFSAWFTATACLFLSYPLISGVPQDTSQKPAEKSAERPRQNDSAQKPEPKGSPQLPAQIELLETHVRFEANGDSRKEVHARVRINDELGVRQFARLNFNYNRAFQAVEIPLAHIAHANGGTSDVLPSAITDNPDPAVVNFPAYQDVRVKSIRILGLAPDDIFEYRVITTTTHHPLAPDFWFEHTFDRSGVVRKEILGIDLPASIAPPTAHWADNVPQAPGKAAISSGLPTPEPTVQRLTVDKEERVLYRYVVDDGSKALVGFTSDPEPPWPDVQVGFMGPVPPAWAWVSHRLYGVFLPHNPAPLEIVDLAQRLTAEAKTPERKIEQIYDFVSQKIRTVDLPLGATGFQLRPAAEVATSGYGTQEDKVECFIALAAAAKAYASNPVLIGSSKNIHAFLPTPYAFAHILVWAGTNVVDPSLEVAPFRMLPASYRGSEALNLGEMAEAHDAISLVLMQIPKDLPFPSSQKVQVHASIDGKGTLSAKAQYTLRGDNELLLRVAFHRAAKEKWKDVAQLLSISDGFRGQITNVNASDPYDTRGPFSVEYELKHIKFLDWAKKPLRIPALLPLVGLPEPAGGPANDAKASPIELGTPLDVEVSATVHLPEGTGAEAPAGTSLQRDFATYESHYSVSDGTLTASRHINFILKEIPADRAAEYNAFLHAVQNDESQLFTLEPPENLGKQSAAAEQKKSSAPPPGATPQKP